MIKNLVGKKLDERVVKEAARAVRARSLLLPTFRARLGIS